LSNFKKPRYWLLALYSTLRYTRFALVPDQFLWIKKVKKYILVDQMVKGWMARATALMGVIDSMKDQILPWPMLLILLPKTI
jgi:hypothetical protein